MEIMVFTMAVVWMQTQEYHPRPHSVSMLMNFHVSCVHGTVDEINKLVKAVCYFRIHAGVNDNERADSLANVATMAGYRAMCQAVGLKSYGYWLDQEL